jgi:hypothetical protein
MAALGINTPANKCRKSKCYKQKEYKPYHIKGAATLKLMGYGITHPALDNIGCALARIQMQKYKKYARNNQ